MIPRRVLLSSIQRDFLDCPSRFAAFCGGIGSGKSFVLCYNRLRSVRPGKLYMMLAPTYPMLRDATLRAFLDLTRQLGIGYDFHRSENRITFHATGAEILFRSTDNPESLRGPNLAGLDMDEASLMPRAVYDIAIGRLRQGNEVGTLRAAFTPKGPTHWTHEVFNTGRPDTAIFRARTDDNPFLAAEFHETVARQYGDTNWARQELGGEFVQIEGAEFPAEWFAGEDLWFDDWPDDLRLKVVALDPSKGTDGGGEDYQAHVLIGARIVDNRWLFYLDTDLQREGVVPMTERTIALCRAFGAGRSVDSVIVEDNSTMGLLPQAFDAACVKLGYPIPYVCRTATERKENRIRARVAPPLSRRQFRFRRTAGARLLFGQLQSFPHDEHDDGPDALAMGLARVAELLQ